MKSESGGQSGLRLVCLALLMATLSPSVSCAQQRTQAPMTAAESARAAEILTMWFQCDECEAGELAAVTSFGQAVVPSLIAVLDGGLSAAAREQLRLDLGNRYDALVSHSRTNPNAKPASSKEEFVAMYLGNRDAQYRVRAAQALGAIGGDRARSALQAALGKAQRPDVHAAIRRSVSQ